MYQLLLLRTRLCPMHPETPHLPILCASSYSLGSQMPKPHLPQGRRLQGGLWLLPYLPPPRPQLW